MQKTIFKCCYFFKLTTYGAAGEGYFHMED